MKSLNTKLALGTVQIGLDYGISNETGKINTNDAFSILNFALKNGIDLLDTASAYGNSESIIGAFVNTKEFRIVSKIPSKFKSIDDEFAKSLNSMGVDSLYGYMYHDFDSFASNKDSYSDLLKLRRKGLVKKLGFSVYYPWQIQYLFDNNIEFDIVQLPYSIFDRRFEYVLSKLKNNGVEIHVRSVFLQGLFFKDVETLDPFFESIKGTLEGVQELACSNNIAVASLCLNYCLSNQFIDKVVIGVDSLANLKMNVDLLADYSKVEKLKSNLDLLKIEDENILLPFNWEL